MAGLLDAIVGSNDPATTDNAGLVESQRRQLLFNTLGSTGALLLAAGQNIMPAQKAQLLSQLGNVPGQQQQMSTEMAQQNLMAQRNIAAQRQNTQQADLLKYTQTPEFQQQFEGLPPSTKAVAMAQLKGGDVAGLVKTLAEARAETTPKFNADGSFYNPLTGDIIYPLTGQKFNIKAMQTQAGQDNSGAGPTDGTGLSGDDYLKTISPSFANTIKGIADGRIPMPTGMIMRTQYGQQLMNALNQYEPGFDATNYGARNATAKAFASGKEAQAVRALNQVTQHMEVLHEKAANLNNTASPLLNQGINVIGKNVFGSSGPTDFVAAAHPVAEELSRAFKGANLSDSEVRTWEQSLNRDMSPEQMQGSLVTMQRLLVGAQDALEQQYKKTMGKDLKPLTPKAQQSIDYIKTHPLDNREVWPENQQQGAAPQAQARQGLAQQLNQPLPQQGAPQQAVTLPPAALAQIREGHITQFGNGTKWTLQGGKPVRVP